MLFSGNLSIYFLRSNTYAHMISSSNFFKKTFFDDRGQETPLNQRLGPWLEQKYQAIKKDPCPVSLTNRVKVAEARTKRSRQEVALPIITSKRLEIGPDHCLHSDRTILRQRKKIPSNRYGLPEVFHSLEIPRPYQKKSENRTIKNLSTLYTAKDSNSHENTIELIRVLGLPTSHFFF